MGVKSQLDYLIHWDFTDPVLYQSRLSCYPVEIIILQALEAGSGKARRIFSAAGAGSAAFLVFLATPAWAGTVPARFLRIAVMRRYSGSSILFQPFFGQFAQTLMRVIKKHHVRQAEMITAVMYPALCTAAATGLDPWTLNALVRKIGFHHSEFFLQWRIEHIG